MLGFVDILFILLSGILTLGAYLVKKKTLYILFQTACNLLLIINYLYLGSISSILVVTVATIRFLVFYVLVKKYDDVPWIMIILFSTLAGVLGTATVKHPIDYLFVVAVMLYTACYKVRSLMGMKIVLLIPLSMMLLYSILMRAYSGIIGHGFEIALILVQTVIFFIKRYREKITKTTRE